MKDPYSVLGVPRQASPEEIKTAYRRLARRLHPDVNRNDSTAEERFKEVSAAYDLLSDARKRARYDRGEIDASGAERGGRPGARPGGGAGFRSRRNTSGSGSGTGSNSGGASDGAAGGFGFDSFFDDEAFADLFRRASQGRSDAGEGRDPKSGPGQAGKRPGSGPGAGAQPPPRPQRGQDAHYRLKVSFEEAALGCTKRITLTNRKTLDVRIPPATEDGRVLRLKGQGAEGYHGGAAGDALVEIGIRPHPVFRRDGDAVVAEIPVTLREAVLGSRITVPTLEGKAAVTVPEHSNTGTVLRLRGKGIPHDGAARGDLLIHLRIVLPDPADPRLKAMVKKLKDPQSDPREGSDPA